MDGIDDAMVPECTEWIARHWLLGGADEEGVIDVMDSLCSLADSPSPSSVSERGSSRQDILQLIRNQNNALQTAKLLARHVRTLPTSELIQILRWLFVDWKLANIALLLRNLHLEPQRQITVIIHLVHDWDGQHIAELLLLLFVCERRRPAISLVKAVIGALAPILSVSVARWLQLYIQKYHISL